MSSLNFSAPSYNLLGVSNPLTGNASINHQVESKPESLIIQELQSKTAELQSKIFRGRAVCLKALKMLKAQNRTISRLNSSLVSQGVNGLLNTGGALLRALPPRFKATSPISKPQPQRLNVNVSSPRYKTPSSRFKVPSPRTSINASSQMYKASSPRFKVPSPKLSINASSPRYKTPSPKQFKSLIIRSDRENGSDKNPIIKDLQKRISCQESEVVRGTKAAESAWLMLKKQRETIQQLQRSLEVLQVHNHSTASNTHAAGTLFANIRPLNVGEPLYRPMDDSLFTVVFKNAKDFEIWKAEHNPAISSTSQGSTTNKDEIFFEKVVLFRLINFLESELARIKGENQKLRYTDKGVNSCESGVDQQDLDFTPSDYRRMSGQFSPYPKEEAASAMSEGIASRRRISDLNRQIIESTSINHTYKENSGVATQELHAESANILLNPTRNYTQSNNNNYDGTMLKSFAL